MCCVVLPYSDINVTISGSSRWDRGEGGTEKEYEDLKYDGNVVALLFSEWLDSSSKD